MAQTKQELLQQLSDCVVEMEDENIEQIITEYYEAGYDLNEGIGGLIDGMMRVSDLYDEEEYYVPELILSSDVMTAGISQFESYMPARTVDSYHATVILGVPEGDTHDIGKNLVKIMLESGGFKVIDLGRDVPVDDFITTAVENNAKVIGLSTLMTTTMSQTKLVVEKLNNQKLHDKIKVIVGGAPITQQFADDIGADGYTASATEVVDLVKTLLEIA